MTSTEPVESHNRTVDDIPLVNRIMPITGILFFLALVLVLFDLARKKCFTWKNAFVTNGVLFGDCTDEDFSFNEGRTECVLSPMSDCRKGSLTHWKPGNKSLDVAILSLSMGDHVVEELLANKNYLVSANYMDVESPTKTEITICPQIDVNIYNTGDLNYDLKHDTVTSDHTVKITQSDNSQSSETARHLITKSSELENCRLHDSFETEVFDWSENFFVMSSSLPRSQSAKVDLNQPISFPLEEKSQTEAEQNLRIRTMNSASF